MTQSMWGPDGEWLGRPAQELQPAPEILARDEQVKLLYEVDDPAQVEGPISDVSVQRSGGGPVATAVTGVLSALCVVGALLALRQAWRWGRRSSADRPIG